MPEPNAKSDYVVGVDLGGTKILAGVFTADGLKCVGKAKLSTKPGRGTEAVMDRIARCVRDALDECDLDLKRCKAVGLGAPGAVDFDGGRVIFAPNLPGWKDVPLKKELEKRLELPVFIENDCNIAVLGVHEKEFGGKPRNLVGLFIGTGIGGGLILNGQLFSGATHTAGEIGHMVLAVDGPKCGCGNKGCLEALASRTAIFNRIQQGVKDGQKTILTDLLDDKLEDLKSGDLRKAIRRGDKFVEKVVEEAAEYIGVAVGNLVNVLNPELVVLGGGVMDALEDEMLGIIAEVAHDYAMPGSNKDLEIVASKLGDDAGITGAAVLARKQLK
ncbi:MAG: ROK family protein [Limisphaerales bacterium]